MRPEILVPSWIPSPAPSEPTRLGERFLRSGLLTSAQITHVLREQRQTHLKFGEVCLERGWITPEDLYQQIPSYTLGLGELLVLRGHLAFDQLRVALAQQRRYGRKLGEILVWRGWLQQVELEEILEIQRLAQSLQFADAWEAIHELQVFPEPEPELMIPDTQPAPLADTYDISSETHPLDHAHQPQLPAQVAALQLQLEMQQREWQAQIESLELQWTEAEQEYHHQIAQLQEQLRLQHQEHKAQQQEIIQRYRRQVRSLEAQITRLQADSQQTQEMLNHSQAQIDSLEEEIRSHQEHDPRTGHPHDQHPLQALQEQWTQEYQARQQLETLATSLRAQRDRLSDKLHRLRPLAERYRQICEDNRSLCQQLAHSQAQVKSLQQQLATTPSPPSPQLRPTAPPSPSPRTQALQVLTRLQQADLIQEEQSRALFRILTTEGGQITTLLAQYTQLSPATIRFFTEAPDPETQRAAPTSAIPSNPPPLPLQSLTPSPRKIR